MEQFCKVNKKCGGCQWLQVPYEEQLAIKEQQLQTLLGKYKMPAPMIPMEDPFFYRNKVQAAFFWDYKKKKTASGIFQSSSGHIIQNDCCLLENRKAQQITATLRRLFDSFKIRPYDEKKGGGTVRHALIRCGYHSGEIMVVLVTATPVFPSKNHFVQALREAHPDITTVVQNINRDGIPLTLGAQNKVLYGKGYITDTLCGLQFRISPASFYQVNPVQCEKLYSKAVELAGLTGNEAVFDAYCGTGTIGLIASKNAKSVLGVELNRSAVKDAITNAKVNGVKNIYFQCGDAGETITALAKEKETFDVVMMDPPRAGASPAFLNALIKMKPKRIIYISCNPTTLARDLQTLTKQYSTDCILGIDMFPHTKHIETVCLLCKK